MKKQLLTAAMAMTLGSSAAYAGGIQIDPTGSGSIGSSSFIDFNAIGSSAGNMIVKDVLNNGGGALGPSTAKIVGHNSFSLGSFGMAGAELTLRFDIPVVTTVTGAPNTAFVENLSWILDGSRTSTFELWFDSSADAAQGSGAGYGPGAGSTLIASTGAITFSDPTGPGVTNLSGGALAAGGAGTDDNSDGLWDLADNDTTPTISSTGSARLALDFVPGDIDTLFVVNDMTSLVIDLTTVNALSTPFNETPGGTVLASTSVFGETALHGDGINNFRCSTVLLTTGICDFQAQMNSTFLGGGRQIPEPTTLALLGGTLGLLGLRRRRANKAA